MDNQLNYVYNKILADYLRTGGEAYLYQVAQFSKDLMKQGMGPESIIEMHFNAVKIINKDKRVYSKKSIDESFTFLMEGVIRGAFICIQECCQDTEV